MIFTKFMSYYYCLGSNNDSTTKKNVLVTISIFPKYTDCSDVENKYKSIYKAHKINIGQVVEITDLDEEEKFDKAYINRIKFNKGSIFKVSNHDYSKYFRYYISVYQHKQGATNNCEYVHHKYTGIKIKFYENGKIENKRYYSNGNLIRKRTFYNNQFNSIKHCVKYNNLTQLPLSEDVYNSNEELSTIYYFNEKGIIDRTNNFQSDRIPLPSLFYKGPQRGFKRKTI